MDERVGTVKLEVILRDGQVSLPGGLPLPRLRRPIHGEFWVFPEALEDRELGLLLAETQWVTLLPTGSPLLLAVNPDGIPASLPRFARRLAPAEIVDRGPTQCWVDVSLSRTCAGPLAAPAGDC